MTYSTLGWLFAVAVTLHNAEEALLLPKWSMRGGRWRAPVGAFEFRFAAAVLALLAYGVAYLSSIQGPQAMAAYAIAGYALAMLLNVFFPHVLATIALRRYMPGTATALLFNLPVCSMLLYVGVQDGSISTDKFAWFGPASVAVILASIPVLFFIGRKARPAFLRIGMPLP
ncbi:HXXEE domain-containing protein [Methylocaldum gracile]|jgi:hypothetical protein|uniref:HXXEE domain-containing protein n=1 Tax=Methylocaldum sp. 0917 TaxID=2485163 RepID=UPI00105BD760